jgi:hypothetical protein
MSCSVRRLGFSVIKEGRGGRSEKQKLVTMQTIETDSKRRKTIEKNCSKEQL